jgi:hypothetical protein
MLKARRYLNFIKKNYFARSKRNVIKSKPKLKQPMPEEPEFTQEMENESSTLTYNAQEEELLNRVRSIETSNE